ncbi:hypothetical protein D3C75_1008830 [compost metagenome]|jgi:hypothetical protein
MTTKVIVFDAETVNVCIDRGSSASVRVTTEADLQTLFDKFKAVKVLELIDRGHFLESICEAFAREYFGIDADE